MTEIIEKKSRFIAYSYDIADESEVKTIIERIRKEHKRSRHVVFAYVVGGKADIKPPADGQSPPHCCSCLAKFNDDGEPSGTAGLPVLNAVKRRELENILVIVVRYFGGILLGKGGLIRAYGKAAGRELDRRAKESNEQ